MGNVTRQQHIIQQLCHPEIFITNNCITVLWLINYIKPVLSMFMQLFKIRVF